MIPSSFKESERKAADGSRDVSRDASRNTSREASMEPGRSRPPGDSEAKTNGDSGKVFPGSLALVPFNIHWIKTGFVSNNY